MESLCGVLDIGCVRGPFVKGWVTKVDGGATRFTCQRLPYLSMRGDVIAPAPAPGRSESPMSYSLLM